MLNFYHICSIFVSLKVFCSWFFPVLCSIAFKFEKHNVHFPTVGWLHGLPRLLLEDSQEKLQHTCDPCEDKWFRWIGGYSIVSLSSCLIQSGKVCIGLMHPNCFWKYSTRCVIRPKRAISSLCQIYEAFLPVTYIHPWLWSILCLWYEMICTWLEKHWNSGWFDASCGRSAFCCLMLL